MKTAQKDMTKGSPGKIILGFTVPLFIGNLFQQFYNMGRRCNRRPVRRYPAPSLPSAAPARLCS